MPTATTSRATVEGPQFTERDHQLWRHAVAARLGGDTGPLEGQLDRLALARAKKLCSRLAHRGGRCTCSPVAGGTSSQSALAAARDVVYRQWALDGSRGARSGVRKWLAAGAREPFLVYDSRVLSGGRDSDVQRRWNSDRGVVAKSEVVARLKDEELARLAAEMRMLPVSDEDWALLAEGVDRSYPGRPAALLAIQDPRLWLDALFQDATQPAPTEIDAARVLRWLEWSKATKGTPGSGAWRGRTERTARKQRLVAGVAAAVDEAIALVSPELHERLLVQPRTRTRGVELWVQAL